MPETATPVLEITCTATGLKAQVKPLKDGSPGLAKDWHRLGTAYYSPKGWASLFALRSIRLPVASVVEGYTSGVPGDWSIAATTAGWQAFRAALRQSSQQAAQYTNLAVAEIYAADRSPLTVDKDGKTKLPPMPDAKVLHARLYELGRTRFPELDSQSMGSLKQKAFAVYKAFRWEMRVTCKKSLPTARDGLPVPIPSKDARIEVSHQHQQDVPEEEREPGRGQPFVCLRLAGHRFTLRLRSGDGDGNKRHTFTRQVAALEMLAAGQALQGEVSIYERRAPAAHGRNGSKDRAAPGATPCRTIPFVSLALWLPKSLSEREDVVIRAVTGKSQFLSVFVGSAAGRPWNLHEQQARGWAIAQRARLHSLSDDTKFERRSRLRGSPVSPADLASLRARICAKYRRRMDDWCHKVTTMVVNFCRRQKACRLIWDDLEQGFGPLPWFKLRSQLEWKLQQVGIEYVWVGGSAESPDA